MKEQYYTIGEMAKLTNLSVQTLRYYDQIDLFKPSYINPDTNYRYYSESQFHNMDLIKALRFLEIPLSTIKEALNFTLEELVKFLMEQESVIDSKISRLQVVQHTLFKTKKQIEDQLSITTFNEVYERNEDDLRILTIKVFNSTPAYVPNEYFTWLMKTVEDKAGIITTHYGSAFPLKRYESIKELEYYYIFTPLHTNRYIDIHNDDMNISTIPGGRYICISFNFSLDNYIVQYKKLFDYINEHNLTVESEVFEYFMATSYSTNQDTEFIGQLKVKIS